MQRVIVDIDNTLWDFASVFQKKLKKVIPEIPSLDDWEWDFYMEYMTVEELYSIVNNIHAEQDIFEPFPSAQWFLDSLLKRDYRVIIASHRHEKTRTATEKFLKKHSLYYTELHLSYNKAILFDSSRALVDDNPILLDEAKQKGLICTGLSYPWNRKTDHSLFQSLEDVLEFLLQKMTSKKELS